jgi:hypothetical protein
MKKDSSIQLSIGIPSEEEIHEVIALGFPDEVYQQVTGRKNETPRYFEGSNREVFGNAHIYDIRRRGNRYH